MPGGRPVTLALGVAQPGLGIGRAPGGSPSGVGHVPPFGEPDTLPGGRDAPYDS